MLDGEIYMENIKERNLDFDNVIDRKGTNSLKYDYAIERGKPADILPLWVADMDFRTSSFILDAIAAQAQHGIYGYSEPLDGYFEATREWMKNHHGWDVKRSWYLLTPGIVFALAHCVRAFTDKGDGVMIQQPVYYPFSEVITDNGRRIVDNTLIYDENTRTYHMDADDFEKKIVDENVKLVFICNPHNPVGRVWTRKELETVGDICHRHNVIVVSDEIHQDFVFKGHHEVFVNIKEEYQDNVITCTAPSKTFNIAGLQISNLFIPNARLKRRLRDEINASGYSQLNAVGLVACEAAYRYGTEWYQAAYEYIKSNISFVKKYIGENLPQIHMIEPEGTYLAWLDFRDLKLSNEQLEDLIVNKARLWLDSGAIFGKAGEGFERINVACPRKTLERALGQLNSVINK
jgi:cystathionine beta-lyase